MSWRKKVDPNNSNVSTVFANWLSQLCMMVLPKYMYLIAGRGSSKTTDIQVERLMEMAHDMPGAPICWVSDTYTNLQQNVLPTIMEGLAMKGWIEGVHYVCEKNPPVFTDAEKTDLPPHIREHFWKPYNQIASYKHTWIFYTGLNITFASLDRPASLAGRNYVHVFGDETKYFRSDRVSNLLKAVRGYRAKYGNSVFYRGHTFTTDMPDTSKIGQYDWMLDQARRLSAAAITLIIKTAIIANECAQEYLVARDELAAADQAGTSAQRATLRERVIKKRRTWQRWQERWTASRLHKSGQVFFFNASSYVNVDILTPEWFQEAFDAAFSDTKAAILGMKPRLEAGERFYANLMPQHFYHDGNDTVWAQRFGLTETEDCRILKYLDRDKPLDGGADFGNMISLVLAQEKGRDYRVQKFMYTLSPEWIRHLADKFIAYYKPHKNKTLNLYYDRAANNYAKAKQDLATQIKKAIEHDAEDRPTGWKVILMSEGQGNIGQNEEYNFMQELMAGQNRHMPNLLIDFYNCKPLRCSLEDAKTHKNRKGEITKDKSSEKLPIHRLPLESTNPSDAFKYLLMTTHRRRLVSGGRRPYTGA